MNVARIKSLGVMAGLGAVGLAVVLNLGPGPSTIHVAGGSGDSSTVGQYTSPTVPAMSVNPTAMTLGATATATPPHSALATEEATATPTVKATPAPVCVNNGQCP